MPASVRLPRCPPRSTAAGAPCTVPLCTPSLPYTFVTASEPKPKPHGLTETGVVDVQVGPAWVHCDTHSDTLPIMSSAPNFERQRMPPPVVRGLPLLVTQVPLPPSESVLGSGVPDAANCHSS